MQTLTNRYTYRCLYSSLYLTLPTYGFRMNQPGQSQICLFLPCSLNNCIQHLCTYRLHNNIRPRTNKCAKFSSSSSSNNNNNNNNSLLLFPSSITGWTPLQDKHCDSLTRSFDWWVASKMRRPCLAYVRSAATNRQRGQSNGASSNAIGTSDPVKIAAACQWAIIAFPISWSLRRPWSKNTCNPCILLLPTGTDRFLARVGVAAHKPMRWLECPFPPF